MVTIVDVARLAGVSTATVSRVVNNPDIVDSKTLSNVRLVIRELDYRPNAVAQGLVSKSSKTIGVVINQFSSSYYGRMLDGAEKALAKLGFKTIAESSRESARGERNAITSLLDRQCDGIVLHADKLNDQQLSDLLTQHPKIILMNRLLQGFEDRCVYLDNVQGGALAAAYLREAGHSKIAVITGPMNFFQSKDRLKGFCSEMARRHHEVDSDLFFEGGFTSDSGRIAMERVLSAPKPVTAVFCLNDQMAAGAIDVCLERGVSVPDEISMLGFDDLEIAKFLYPKLTTIRQPLRDIGAAAGSLAYAIATKADQSAHKRTFKAEIIERRSIRRPGASVEVAKVGRQG